MDITQDDNILGARAYSEDGISVEEAVQQYLTGLTGLCAQQGIVLHPAYQGQHWCAHSGAWLYDQLSRFFSNWLQSPPRPGEYHIRVYQHALQGVIQLRGDAGEPRECRFPLQAHTALPPTTLGEAQIVRYALSALVRPEPGVTPGPILVVDASLEICRFWQSVLQEHYAVSCATNRFTLQQELLASPVSLILADPQLPEGDCLPLLSQSGKPWLACSTLAVPDFDVRCLTGGALAFYTKPFCARSIALGIKNASQHLKAVSTTQNVQPKSFRVRVLEHIARHLQQPSFGVAQLAGLCFMETRTLQRQCLAQFALTPAQLIRQCKMRLAADRLMAGEAVAVVAEHCGFEHSEAFSRAFKHFYACSPKEFKQRTPSVSKAFCA